MQRWKRLRSFATDNGITLFRSQPSTPRFSSDIEDLLVWITEAEIQQASNRTLPKDLTRLCFIIRQHSVSVVLLCSVVSSDNTKPVCHRLTAQLSSQWQGASA